MLSLNFYSTRALPNVCVTVPNNVVLSVCFGSRSSVIAGGEENTASGYAATIAGGDSNSVSNRWLNARH